MLIPPIIRQETSANFAGARQVPDPTEENLGTRGNEGTTVLASWAT